MGVSEMDSESVRAGDEGAASFAGLFERVIDADPVRKLLRALDAGESPQPLGGVTGSLFSVLAAALHARLGRPLLLLVPDDPEAEGIVEDLELLGLGDEVRLLPRRADDARGRARVVAELRKENHRRMVVASVRSALDPVPAGERLDASELLLRPGAALDRDDLAARLAGAGLAHETVVDRPGTYSVRGDVVDLFLPQESLPLRVEFLDERIEGLRLFDPATQISVRVVGEHALSIIPETAHQEEGGSLLEHLPGDVLLLSRDAARLAEALEKNVARTGEEESRQRRDLFAALTALPGVSTSRLALPSSQAWNLGGRVIAPEGTSFEEALATLDRVSRGKALTILTFETDAERKRFRELLAEHGGEVSGRPLCERPFRFVVGRLHEGFHAPFLGLAVLAHHELFAVPRMRRRREDVASVETRAIESFLELEQGDIVVHLVHGIARFEGLVREEKGGCVQEFLALGFKDDVRLLVPVVRIDLVQKYVGGRGEAPDLSRLGSPTWGRRKEKVARAVGDLAAELLEIQALRRRQVGIQHPPDTPWQQEFEAAFPYTLTRDQAQAVEAIKADMESTRPMDRLVCGDVGFGKTEVAMRAAFKCVMGGRQVALLAPTTVLAQQHWNVFRERMGDYPVVIECLSRFRTKKEQAGVLDGLETGAVDIVIGTHRLVQGDVSFKDLGLLILDEEQRFGVAHKEHLRRLRRNVDVLVLSATPIPRTLHQALLGIRDISSLSEAPRGRQAVITEVAPWDDGLVRSGILRELDRGGQVFFVHNRVHSIHRMADKLRKLVPEARFLVAHGQMPERQLEQAMIAFLEREADVLLCTSIIESGLDIPSVNTIFVDDAHTFGLADLHQLRGRVGRLNQRAHAIFLIGRDRVVSTIAEKRLRAIEEFSGLGAGFRIAMRDMEIRGAGNILGAEQSGHIAAVGYELYCRLLEAAVGKVRTEDLLAPREVEINVDFTAFLPEGYIPDGSLRIEIYRKLARARSRPEFEAIQEELRDRFGPLPGAAREFVLVARLRALLEETGAIRLETAPGDGLILTAAGGRRLQRRLARGGAPYRDLGRGRFLLVREEGFSSPADVLSCLERALDVSTPRETGEERASGL